MKKSIILISGVVLVFLVVLAAGLWFFMRPPSRVVAECLPSHTMVYATFPNLTKTAVRYEFSDLKKILSSNEVAAMGGIVLEKIRRLSKKSFSDEDRKCLEALKDIAGGESFVAITRVDFAEDGVELVAGTRPMKRGALGVFLKGLEGVDERHGKSLQKGDAVYEGVKYVCYQIKDRKSKYCAAEMDGWIIFSKGEGALREFIDFYRNPLLKEKSLAGNPDFTFVMQQFKEPQDFALFANIEEVGRVFENALDRIGDMRAKTSRDQARSSFNPEKSKGMIHKYLGAYRGLALGLRFNKEKLAERWVIAGRDGDLFKSLVSIYEPSPMATAKFTGYDTLFYWTGGFNLKNYLDYSVRVYSEAGLSVEEVIGKVKEGVAYAGLDFEKNLVEALGGECSFQIDWGKEAVVPNVAFYLGVRDASKFKPVRDFIEKAIPQVAGAMGGLTISESAKNETKIFSTSIASMSDISPTLTMDDKFVSLQLTEKGALQNLSRKEAETVLTRDVLKKKMEPGHPPYIQVLYCDTPELIDRGYSSLRRFGLKSPKVTGLFPIPASKWPEKLSFTPHLGQVYWTAGVSDSSIMTLDAESGIGSQIIPLYSVVFGGIIYAAAEKLEVSQNGKSAGSD